jgi:hypothetical protein
MPVEPAAAGEPLADSGQAPAPTPQKHAFDYAIVRVVPRVEREEFVNVGVIVHCPTLEFLAARVELDRARLRALAPEMDDASADEIELYLQGIPRICAGGADGGPIGRMALSARFHWLVAPRSHVIQTGPVHTGLCSDPDAAIGRLLDAMVRRRPA